MCGIAGLLSASEKRLSAVIGAMTSALEHRGPDGSGEWVDTGAGIALGHRRLSIVDLSPEGSQPMHSHCGRYVLTFNGEIYNHVELRQRCGRDHPWRGHSDTEVMLAAISAWGLDRALPMLVGMYAFALWDRKERVLHLVRDRLGEKPLYYGEVPGGFAFASELKALLHCFEDQSPRIHRGALQALMQFGYIPAPISIYEGIYKLPAAGSLSLRVLPGGQREVGAVVRYWSPQSTDAMRQQAATASDVELEEQLHGLIDQSVRAQMMADVPLGAFLSGGIDSSTIVALMQRASSKPVRTFTIGFSEQSHDEAPYAKRVAQHLGTEHTELYVSPEAAAAVIPRLPTIFDEPFADSSQIPTFLVAQMTRQFVTVSLSGDGGDELFAGYPRYAQGEQLWRRMHRLPRWGRALCGQVIGSVTPTTWDGLLGTLLPRGTREVVNGHRLHRLSRVLKSNSLLETYIGMVSQWQHDDGLVAGSNARLHYEAAETSARAGSPLDQMRQFDLHQYLPDDILVKVDRASMNVSLESRAPFLDHRVVEFAFNLPERVLVREGNGKWLLRRVLDRYVPRELIDRPKAGFALPVGKWLRHELRPWAESLLTDRSSSEYLESTVAQRMWQQHLSGTHDRSAYLWSVLMFQAWLRDQPEQQRTNFEAGRRVGVA